MAREDGFLWLGNVAGPLAWFTDLALSYRLVELGHTGPGRMALWVVSACAIVVSLAGAGVSAAMRRRVAETDERRRWMAMTGLVFGVFFALVIVAQAMPRLFLRPGDIP